MAGEYSCQYGYVGHVELANIVSTESLSILRKVLDPLKGSDPSQRALKQGAQS